jgi:hypothetical protein
MLRPIPPARRHAEEHEAASSCKMSRLHAEGQGTVKGSDLCSFKFTVLTLFKPRELVPFVQYVDLEWIDWNFVELDWGCRFEASALMRLSRRLLATGLQRLQRLGLQPQVRSCPVAHVM